MLFPIRQNNRYGFLLEDGTIAVIPEYDLVFDFQFNACVVIKNGKYGLISSSGEIILRPEHTFLTILDENRLCLKENKKCALTTFHGKLLTPFEYDSIFAFSEGMAVAYKGLKFGYLSEEGKEAIPFDFDFAENFQLGYAMVKQGEKYGLINKKGIFEKAPSFDFYYGYDQCYVVNQGGKIFDDDISGGKFGLLSKDNKLLTALSYDFIGQFVLGEAMVKNQGLYGSINDKGEITAAIDSKEPIKIKEEYRTIVQEKKYGLADEEGNIIIPKVYEDLIVYPKRKFCWAKQNGLYGILNFENIFVVPPSFDLNIIYPIHENHVTVEFKNGKHGLLALPSGDWLLPPEFDSIGVFKGSLVDLKKDGKYGYANREGKIVWME